MTSRFGAGALLVVFDLDGTLVDSAPDLNYCLGVALASAGFEKPAEAQTRSWIGGGVEMLIRRALDWAGGESAAAKFDAVYAEFSDRYRENLFVRSTLYPQVPETLDTLLARGLALSCVTNKRLEFAERVLELAGIRDRFGQVIGGDSLPQKKPSPAPLRAAAAAAGAAESAAVLVGDSDQDYAAAKAAGWPFVWARYGYRERLADAPSSVVSIGRFGELVALLGD